jgi:hypothetical protein
VHPNHRRATFFGNLRRRSACGRALIPIGKGAQDEDEFENHWDSLLHSSVAYQPVMTQMMYQEMSCINIYGRDLTVVDEAVAAAAVRQAARLGKRVPPPAELACAAPPSVRAARSHPRRVRAFVPPSARARPLRSPADGRRGRVGGAQREGAQEPLRRRLRVVDGRREREGAADDEGGAQHATHGAARGAASERREACGRVRREARARRVVWRGVVGTWRRDMPRARDTRANAGAFGRNS